MSSRLRSLALAILGAVSLLAAPTACRDAVAPEPVAQQPAPDALLGLPDAGAGDLGRLVDTTITALTWAEPLQSDITRSAVIGPAGGSITISEIGFRFTVPAGALSEPTNLTVTAVAGSVVAYEFEPHGLRFDDRATFSQELRYTGLTGLLGVVMKGAYFESRGDIFPDGTANVTEIIPTRLDFLPLRVKFPVRHFSGYIVAVD